MDRLERFKYRNPVVPMRCALKAQRNRAQGTPTCAGS
jgi:hypothetical protein